MNEEVSMYARLARLYRASTVIDRVVLLCVCMANENLDR